MSETLTERTMYLPEILTHHRLVVATVFQCPRMRSPFQRPLADFQEHIARYIVIKNPPASLSMSRYRLAIFPDTL